MSTLDAIILGIVQGLTEFFPVSSSGHLHIVQHLLGLQELDQYILFDLACHLGTLLAIVFFFFQRIKDLFKGDRARLFQIALATAPLFPLVLVMKPIKAAYADPSYMGLFFILTSAILFLGIRFGKTVPETARQPNRWRDALLIGTWQAAAILPGVSRSGSTISGARLLGWSPNDAVFFSFMLAIPAVLGGTTLEVYKYWRHPEAAADVSMLHYFIGFSVSFAVGLFGLRLLMRIIASNKFSYFAWYCLFLGLATAWYFQL